MSLDTWWKQPFNATKAKKPRYLAHCAKCRGINPPVRCSKCSAVAYCGRACQVSDWSSHKKKCAQLAAQAAAAEAAEVSAGLEVSVNGGSIMPSSDTTTSSPKLQTRIAELYPYQDFLEHWKSINLAGHTPYGFSNLNNTCYANALIQIFMATRPLAAHLLSVDHVTNCAKLPGKWCPMCWLSGWMYRCHKGPQTSRALLPRELILNIKTLNPRLKLGDQHDAQELYTSFIEALELVSVREAEQAASLSGTVLPRDPSLLQTTPINHVFSCSTRTQVDWLMCGNISGTISADTGIMLNVPKRGDTLETLLKEWSAIERLEGTSAYQCDACHAKVKAEKSTMLEVAPNVLSIHLSRVDFMYGESKTTAPVKFPKELDMTSFMALDARDVAPAEYELYGVVAHEGITPDDGHYTAFVRFGDSWYFCDDDIVEEVSTAEVLNQQREAYLLFYERKEAKMVIPEQDGVAKRVLAGVDEGGSLTTTAAEALTNFVNGDTMEESTDSSSGSQEESSDPVLQAVRAYPSPAMPAGALKEGAEERILVVEKEMANGSAGEVLGSIAAVMPGATQSGGDLEPSWADTPSHVEESSVEIDDSEDSIYEVGQIVGPSGRRELRLSVHLPAVIGDYEPVFKIHASGSGTTWAEVGWGETQLLRMPLPLPVALPAKRAEWSCENKKFIAIFDVT